MKTDVRNNLKRTGHNNPKKTGHLEKDVPNNLESLKKTRLSSHAKRTETALKKKIATGKVATGKSAVVKIGKTETGTAINAAPIMVIMKEAVKTGITEEERKMTTRTTETIAKSRMKSHKLLYQLKNKLTWLPILILAACQNNIIYHSYAPVPLDGWDKSDTLVYTLPNSIPAGKYVRFLLYG